MPSYRKTREPVVVEDIAKKKRNEAIPPTIYT
jgi:hypothetical protein